LTDGLPRNLTAVVLHAVTDSRRTNPRQLSHQRSRRPNRCQCRHRRNQPLTESPTTQSPTQVFPHVPTTQPPTESPTIQSLGNRQQYSSSHRRQPTSYVLAAAEVECKSWLDGSTWDSHDPPRTDSYHANVRLPTSLALVHQCFCRLLADKLCGGA
jgi:hypothetical protein